MKKLFSLFLISIFIVSFGSGLVLAEDSMEADFNPDSGTVEMWVKSIWGYEEDGSGGGHQTLFYWGPEEWANELRLFFYDQKLISPRWMSDGEVQAPDVPIEDWKANQWYYVAVTWSAEEQVTRMYLDGEKVSEFEGWKPPQGEVDEYYIGSDAKDGKIFLGDIEGFTLTDEFKNDAQIKEDYEETKTDYEG